MMTGCLQQLTLWDLGPQQVTVTFQGGRIVSDAGLLGIRKLDKELGVLSLLAERLPDPRVQNFVVHSRATLFSQQVYQILAGYQDIIKKLIAAGVPAEQIAAVLLAASVIPAQVTFLCVPLETSPAATE